MAVGHGESIGAERALPLTEGIVWIWAEMFIAFWGIFPFHSHFFLIFFSLMTLFFISMRGNWPIKGR